MDEAPGEILGQKRQRLEKHRIALLLNRAPDTHEDRRVGGIRSVTRRAFAVESAETLQIEPVIAQMDACRVAAEASEFVETGLGARRDEPGVSELFGELPIGRGPNILGMRRAAPCYAGEEAGIERDRRWRVDEMGMQPVGFGWKFRGEHQRLAETAPAVAGRVALEIGQEGFTHQRIAREPTCLPPRTQDPQRLVMEIFRQIGHRSLDIVMDRMTLLLGRMAHRDKGELQALQLEPAQLLGDERL